MTRICREAGLFQKTWHEFAGKLSYFKKPDTNLQGSWLFPKKLARTCKEAGFPAKIRGQTNVWLVAQLDRASAFQSDRAKLLNVMDLAVAIYFGLNRLLEGGGKQRNLQ